MSGKKTSSSAKKAEPETFEARDVVLGKIRGFPPWPGMVVDPATVPRAVAKERPAGKKNAVYPVWFFPAADYAWLSPKEITRLTPTQINSFINDDGARRKGGELMEGYRIALNPDPWEQTRKIPMVDELDEEEEEEEGGETKKKRRRAASAAAKGRKGGRKSTASEEDEVVGGEESENRASKKAKVADSSVAEYESDPEALKVREWRHKLQKTFLSNKTVLKDEDTPAIDALFTAVESYEDMNVGYLTFSKIGKVMRHISLLPPADVPRDEEYRFRARAKALVDRWHTILSGGAEA
ncbi:hypothetical protein C8R46DRAFT_1096045 [Mycena filopes]|nr:hypothetical protein C8R46DRAFT_1096045 [Mycena filopes]